MDFGAGGGAVGAMGNPGAAGVDVISWWVLFAAACRCLVSVLDPFSKPRLNESLTECCSLWIAGTWKFP